MNTLTVADIPGLIEGASEDRGLGHEFVGRVEACASAPGLVGRRMVGEINAGGDREAARCRCADAAFARNHAPGRTVLGIIGRDGALAEYLALPASCLLPVPDALPD